MRFVVTVRVVVAWCFVRERGGDRNSLLPGYALAYCKTLAKWNAPATSLVCTRLATRPLHPWFGELSLAP